ncbi:MAG: hypothetical protein ACXACX_11060, partial [Candidatus Hodarchaeales archaeon]
MSFFHTPGEKEEEFQYFYLEIQQIWLILRSGLCIGHWHFHGESLESNLFAAFVSALFSFSKDMSSSTNKIRNMSFSELDIYYLPGPTEDEDKYFTAIAVNQKTDPVKTMNYLEFISNRFRQSFENFIRETPAIMPSQFNHFHKSITSFILINEHISKFKYPSNPDFKFSFDSNIVKTQYQDGNIGILCEDNILRIFSSNPLKLINCFFIEQGLIKNWYIDEITGSVIILNDNEKKTLTINPLRTEDSETAKFISIPMENAQWIIPDKEKTGIYYILSPTQFTSLNLSSKSFVEEKPIVLTKQFNQVMYHDNIGVIILVDSNGEVFGIESMEFITNPSPVPISSKVLNVFKGPKGSIYFYHKDGSVAISNLTSTPIPLNSDLSKFKTILFTPKDDSVLFISPNKIDIFDELGRLLVSYPIHGYGLSGVIEYNKSEDTNNLLLIGNTGVIEFFGGIIDRKRIYEQQQMYERKFDSIIKKISRISNSCKNIRPSLSNESILSNEIQNQVNQCKVFRQQLRNVIPSSLKTQTTLPTVFQRKISRYEKQVDEIYALLDELDIELSEKYENTHHKELRSLSSIDRIMDFIAKLRPRESVPVSDM